MYGKVRLYERQCQIVAGNRLKVSLAINTMKIARRNTA